MIRGHIFRPSGELIEVTQHDRTKLIRNRRVAIGWSNCSRAAGVLNIRAEYVSGRDRGTNFGRASDEEVARSEVLYGLG